MARVSFTLRKDNVDRGSFLRYDGDVAYVASGSGGSVEAVDPESRVDYDSALRADGLQIAPVLLEESFFSAMSSCYGEVDLEWSLPLAQTLTGSPQAMGVVLVYSALGEPQTIASGSILVESNDTFSFRQEDLHQGRWAYYALFVNYRSNVGDDYYERVAALSVLVPREYGSTMLLWERVPEYYREQDARMGAEVQPGSCYGEILPPGKVIGPLYRYLSIIGFEIDRYRTLVDYVMESKDPALANTETLDSLAHLLGVDMRSSDLGSARLRNVINDIGYFRRSKGTIGAIKFFAKAITGCDLAIDQVEKRIAIFAQRVNYMPAPVTGTGYTAHRAAHVSEVTEGDALAFSSTTYAAYDSTIVKSGTEYSSNGGGASVGVTHMMLKLENAPVPVVVGDRVVFSVHSGLGGSAMKWARVVDSTGVQMGFSNVLTTVDGSPGFEVLITDSPTLPWLMEPGYVEILVDLSNATVFDMKNTLVEKNNKGRYFDGSTTRGGWLIDSSSISDYRWSGSAGASVSMYTEDYERTKGVINSLLFEAFPITEDSSYTILSYSAIPGFLLGDWYPTP